LVLGRVAHKRGRENEARVLDACQLPSRPVWMHSARAATREEDADGIDVVIESDIGKLYVQVKSSRGGKAAFLQKRRRALVAVVVVGPANSLESTLAKVVGEVGKVRHELLRQRSGEGRWA
jgi:hypothetical protein